MAVYKDKKRGTWYADIKYSIEGVTYAHKKRGFELKRDAIAYEHEFRKSLSKPKYYLTLETAFREYLSLSHSKKETKQNIIRKFTVFLSDYKTDRIDSFTPKKILQVNELIKNSKYSKSYKNYALAHFKAVLRYADENYNIQTRYKLISKLPKTTDDIIVFETWSNEEFEQFIKCVDNIVYKNLFIVLFRTGLRRGEALALTYDDLVDDKYLLITKAYRRQIDTLKNLSSQRTVLIDDITLQALKELQLPQGTYFFGFDNMLSLSTIQRYFDKGIKDSGVKKIRIHDLRHSHATNLINNGANIVAVSKRLGHSDIKMTISTYTNILEKTDEELLKLI